MQRSTLMTIVFAVGFLMFPFDVTGQIPRTLSYQGILTDTSGTPKPDGNYGIAFRLYNVPGGGSALWTETKTLEVRHGLFSTILGDVTSFGATVAFDRQYWLSIQVSPEPELSPRIPLSAVGYSINSLRADTARVALNATGQGIADSARIAGTVPNNSITGAKIANGQVVRSLNGVRDLVTLRAQGGATITSSGDTITINAGTGGGGTGIQGVQNTNNTLDIINPNGPTATANLKVPLTMSAATAVANSSVLAATNAGTTGIVHGLVGKTNSNTQYASGVYGEGLATSGYTVGVLGYGTLSPNGAGVAGFGSLNGVYGFTTSGLGGVFGRSENTVGVRGESNTNFGVYGIGATGVYGQGGSHGGSFSGSSFGVYGLSGSGTGIFGQGGTHGGSFVGSDFGVYGQSGTGTGGYFSGVAFGVHGYGLRGVYGQGGTTGGEFVGAEFGIYARATLASGLAGYFDGKISVAVLDIRGGSDIAEPFLVSDGNSAEPGTLLVIDEEHPGKLKVSISSYDSRVAGVVSGAGGIHPGVQLHQDGMDLGNTNVAIAGRVYCKAESFSSPIQPGDLLTTSNIPGHAMKAIDSNRSHGSVIGKAMSSLKEGTGLVLVLVNLQ